MNALPSNVYPRTMKRGLFVGKTFETRDDYDQAVRDHRAKYGPSRGPRKVVVRPSSARRMNIEIEQDGVKVSLSWSKDQGGSRVPSWTACSASWANSNDR